MSLAFVPYFPLKPYHGENVIEQPKNSGGGRVYVCPWLWIYGYVSFSLKPNFQTKGRLGYSGGMTFSSFFHTNARVPCRFTFIFAVELIRSLRNGSLAVEALNMTVELSEISLHCMHTQYPNRPDGRKFQINQLIRV